MEWIEIKDGCKIPDYDHPVLWLCENGNMHVEALDKDGNPWLFMDDPEWGEMGMKATHWRELPLTPDETPQQPEVFTREDIMNFADWLDDNSYHRETKGWCNATNPPAYYYFNELLDKFLSSRQSKTE